VDPQGLLRRTKETENTENLSRVRLESARRSRNSDARRSSLLRKVSLPRLEKAIQLRTASGRPVDESMLLFAGLRKIQYVIAYPESGDLVIAGPAGDWTFDGDGRIVSTEDAHPVIRLDDFVVILRHAIRQKDGVFGCAISPTQQGLTSIKQFIDRTSTRPLRRGERKKWLEGLHQSLGLQEVDVFGIDPGSGVARTLVEADLHMKLIGMGLEESIPEVTSYLDRIKIPRGGAPPPLEVLRWWFTLKLDSIRRDNDENSFEMLGQVVRLQSENEFLDEQGRRVPTGQSEPLNAAFADDFTRHYSKLVEKYPIYGELENVFQLAVVAALIHGEQLAEKTAWHAACFRDESTYVVPSQQPPKWVDSVINYRLIDGIHVIAGVSGGVRVQPELLLQGKVAPAGSEEFPALRLTPQRHSAQDQEQWWWD
jgi:hypothetical protein